MLVIFIFFIYIFIIFSILIFLLYFNISYLIIDLLLLLLLLLFFFFYILDVLPSPSTCNPLPSTLDQKADSLETEKPEINDGDREF